MPEQLLIVQSFKLCKALALALTLSLEERAQPQRVSAVRCSVGLFDVFRNHLKLSVILWDWLKCAVELAVRCIHGMLVCEVFPLHQLVGVRNVHQLLRAARGQVHMQLISSGHTSIRSSLRLSCSEELHVHVSTDRIERAIRESYLMTGGTEYREKECGMAVSTRWWRSQDDRSTLRCLGKYKICLMHRGAEFGDGWRQGLSACLQGCQGPLEEFDNPK